MFRVPLQDSTIRWTNANQLNLHKESSTPEKPRANFQSPPLFSIKRNLKLSVQTEAAEEISKYEQTPSKEAKVPVDFAIRMIELQLELLKFKCDSQSLEVFRLEQEMADMKVSADSSDVVKVVGTTEEEATVIENEISALEKKMEEEVESNENVETSEGALTVNVNPEIEKRKIQLNVKVTDLVEKQESQSTAVLELSNIISSRKEALRCFRLFRKEQRQIIKTLEDERAELDRETWGSQLPTPSDGTEAEYADKKIQMLRDQLSRTEESYLRQEELFNTRVATEREKLHEIKDQLQALQDGYHELYKKNDEFQKACIETPAKSPRNVFMRISPAFRRRLGSTDSNSAVKANRERTASVASINSVGSASDQNTFSGGNENSRFTIFQSKQGPAIRPTLSDTLKALARPRSPKASQLQPKRGVIVKTGIILQRELELSWIPRQAVLYKCDECYQLRLADSSKNAKPDILNLIPEGSSISAMSDEYPEQPYWLSVETSQYNVGRTKIILAFDSEKDCEAWTSCLKEATSPIRADASQITSIHS